MSNGTTPKEQLRLHQRVGLAILWGISRTLHCSPRWFRFYLLRPFFILCLRLSRYRRGVIRENLERSFPEKSRKEHRQIIRKFYSTLAEIIVDTLSLAGATPERDGAVIEWENRDEHLMRTEGRDWIAMASHFGCWEYFPLWCWQDQKSLFMGVYHPLKNVVFEHYYRRLRALAPNIHQVPMKETIRYYIKNRSEERGIVLGLISDQSPNLRPDTEWFDFLNQKTAFIDGSEKIALRFKLPIYFVDSSRISPGRYSVRFVELYDGKEDIEPNEITRRYAEMLEAMIRRSPELWMWSHRRWKHTPEKQAAKFGTSTLK